MKLNTFALAYIECALWSSTDESTPSGGYPLDRNYSINDIDADTLTAMMNDCAKFQEAHWDDISEDVELAGHDFWLTRNGHEQAFGMAIGLKLEAVSQTRLRASAKSTYMLATITRSTRAEDKPCLPIEIS